MRCICDFSVPLSYRSTFLNVYPNLIWSHYVKIQTRSYLSHVLSCYIRRTSHPCTKSIFKCWNDIQNVVFPTAQNLDIVHSLFRSEKSFKLRSRKDKWDDRFSVSPCDLSENIRNCVIIIWISSTLSGRIYYFNSKPIFRSPQFEIVQLYTST